jgi:hypothetical protein
MQATRAAPHTKLPVRGRCGHSTQPCPAVSLSLSRLAKLSSRALGHLAACSRTYGRREAVSHATSHSEHGQAEPANALHFVQV